MSSPLEDGTARRSQKVTERPSGLDEPLVLVPSGAGFGWNAEPGAFRLPAVPMGAAAVRDRCPPKCGHPHWGQRYTRPSAYLRECTSWGTSGGGGPVTTRFRDTGVDRNQRTDRRRQYFPGDSVFSGRPSGRVSACRRGRAEGRLSQPAGSRASPRRAATRRPGPGVRRRDSQPSSET